MILIRHGECHGNRDLEQFVDSLPHRLPASYWYQDRRSLPVDFKQVPLLLSMVEVQIQHLPGFPLLQDVLASVFYGETNSLLAKSDKLVPQPAAEV